MGLVASKGLLDFSQSSSPVSNRNHVLSIDPRSPSEEFPRTPISVEDESPSMPNLNWLLDQDPRSPSIGFQRTPIPIAPLPLNAAIEDPRSPTAEVPRTPLEKATYGYMDTDEENNEIELDPPSVKITTTPNFAIHEDNGNTYTIESNGNYQRININVKQLFRDDNSTSPRYPLGISNRPNSLRIRAQHNLHASKLASSLPNKPLIQQMRQLSLAESLDKENSPVH